MQDTATATSVTVSVEATKETSSGTGSVTVDITTSTPPVQPDTTPYAVTLNPSSVNITGSNSTSVTATVTNASGGKLSGKNVSVALKTGSSAVTGLTVTSPTGTTSADGTISIPISASATAVTGSTTYTVTCGTASAEMTINVTAATPSVNVTVSATANPISINPNGYSTITATISTAGVAGTDYNEIRWISSVPSVASFSVESNSLVANSSKTITNTLVGKTVGTTNISVALYKSGINTPVATSTPISVNVGNVGATLSPTPSTATVNLNNWTINNNGYYERFSVVPWVNGSAAQNVTNATYTWVLNKQNVQTNANLAYFDLTPYNDHLLYGNSANTLTCTANFTANGVQYTNVSFTWTIYTGYENHLASVNVANSYNYSLSSRDDAGNSSIVDQLISRYGNLYGTTYVQFTSYPTHTYGSINANTSLSYSLSSSAANYLGNLVFTPSGSAGKAIFYIRVYHSGTNNYTDGTICFDTGTTTTVGDINYAASIGDTQYFNAADFENLYYDKTNGGTLSYVTFSTPSSGTGTLYADGVRLTSYNNQCYVSPSSRQTALDSVYFTPSGTTATRAGTVRIGFTAYGSRGSSSSYYNRTITGTVVINYLNGNAKDITYTPVGGSVTLKASDFTDKYREVVGSSAPSDLTIQFQDVPANGSLSYRNSSSSSSSTVSLRSSNIKSYRFTTRTSGANQLGDVTYTSSGTRSDTISYIAYSGSTARFSGKVVFNPNTASTTLTVGLPCTGSAGVAFNAASFTLANPAVMANCSQIRFMAPTNGTLTYAGAAVSYSGVTVLVSMLGQIHYKPNAGFNNNTDRVAFICYDAAGNQIGSGQVNIVVSGNTGGASGGVTNIGGFTDLPKDGSGDWYMSVLSSLVSRGIVQGTGNGKAEPRGKLNYGQALKMILLAANYPAQTEVAGNDWAINYKNLAVQNGLISSSVVLTDPITRDAVVELAAKALKIAPVTGNSPFKDSNNGYAIALNRTSPQIIVGNANGTFNGSGTLLRQEVWMIIYRMYEYSNSQSSTQMPDGI